MAIIHVRFPKEPKKSHQIIIESGILKRVPDLLSKFSSSNEFVIITDTNVKKLYGQYLLQEMLKKGLNIHLISFQAGEKNKNLKTVEEIMNKLLKLKISRHSCIIGLGGGVVGDIAGLVASTYMRGVELIQVPTTLLAMVDSSIGGKTGVNLSAGKNLFGTFYQPKAILVDPNVLKTLSINEIENGFAEIIKYSIISKSPLLGLLEKNTKNGLTTKSAILNKIIIHCARIKASIITKDENENGIRKHLNYGHTVGHAIEKHLNYSVSHGRAIALGMNIVNKIGRNHLITNENTLYRVKKLINEYVNISNLERKIHDKKTASKLWEIMHNDKKVQNSKIHFVIPKSVGKIIIDSTTSKEEFTKLMTQNEDN